MNLNVDALRQRATKPIKKWPSWYKGTIDDFYHTFTPEQRDIANKVKALCNEAVANGVVKDLNTFHGKPLPAGYVYRFDDLLNEAHELFHTIGIDYTKN